MNLIERHQKATLERLANPQITQQQLREVYLNQKIIKNLPINVALVGCSDNLAKKIKQLLSFLRLNNGVVEFNVTYFAKVNDVPINQFKIGLLCVQGNRPLQILNTNNQLASNLDRRMKKPEIQQASESSVILVSVSTDLNLLIKEYNQTLMGLIKKEQMRQDWFYHKMVPFWDWDELDITKVIKQTNVKSNSPKYSIIWWFSKTLQQLNVSLKQQPEEKKSVETFELMMSFDDLKKITDLELILDPEFEIYQNQELGSYEYKNFLIDYFNNDSHRQEFLNVVIQHLKQLKKKNYSQLLESLSFKPLNVYDGLKLRSYASKLQIKQDFMEKFIEDRLFGAHVDQRAFKKYMKDGIEFNSRLLKYSSTFNNDVIVYSGGFSKDGFPQIGKLITYHAPLSTSLDLSIAINFLKKSFKNQRLFRKTEDVSDICCLYQIVLPAGYPITYVQTGSDLYDFENEILLPWFLPDQQGNINFNQFKVIDIFKKKIRYDKEPRSENNYVQFVKNNEKENEAQQMYLDTLDEVLFNTITIIKIKSTLF